MKIFRNLFYDGNPQNMKHGSTNGIVCRENNKNLWVRFAL